MPKLSVIPPTKPRAGSIPTAFSVKNGYVTPPRIPIRVRDVLPSRDARSDLLMPAVDCSSAGSLVCCSDPVRTGFPDGEDDPADINKLAAKSLQTPGKIIFAERNKRRENLVFRSFYVIYKLIFKLLTGKIITFGNFSLVPQERLQNLVRVSEIWNNYPGGIIKSRIPYDSVLTDRATRLAGESKMNFVSLVLHGLSAISVMVDTTAVRILIFSICMSGVAIGFIVFIIFLKIIGNATPGWASTLGSTLMILMLQSFLISLFLVFMVLQYRSQQHFIPAVHYRDFVEKVETFS